MSAAALQKKIAWHSRDTGIPMKELQRMCIEAGLEQLARGELKVSARPKKGARK